MQAQRQSPAPSLAPAARTATANGSSVDLATFESADVLFVMGAITDGTHTPKVQESDDGSSFADAPAASLSGSLADLTANAIRKVKYIGTKRHIRARIEVAGATTGALSSAIVVRGTPQDTNTL